MRDQIGLEKHIARFREEDSRIVAALARAGVPVTSIQDLVRERRSYAQAIPTLIEMLGQIQYLPVRECVVRALGVREAKGKAEAALVAEYEKALDLESLDADSFRWAIGNTLYAISTKRLVEPLLRLLGDPRGGDSKEMMALAAAKTKDARFIPILLGMLDRGECPGHVAIALGKLKSQESIGRLRKLAKSKVQTSWVRREARKALERIGAELEEGPVVN